MTSTPFFRTVIRAGLIAAAVIAVLGGGIGLAVAGVPGLLGGLVGAVLTCLFMLLTAGSMLLAARVAGGDATKGSYFGIVLGGWLVKFILFLVLLFWLRGQDWISFPVLYAALLVSIISSLVIDVVALRRSRMPYVDVALPGDDRPGADAPDDRR